MDILHEVWSPKWRFFKPPMWKIFRWAYNIKRTLYTGGYPKAINNGGEPINKEMTISFKCVPYNNPEVDKATEHMKRRIRQVQKGGSGSVQTQIGIVNNYIMNEKEGD